MIFFKQNLRRFENKKDFFANLRHFNNFILDLLPKGFGHERDSRSHARCLPLQLTDHNTGISLLFSTSARILLTLKLAGGGGGFVEGLGLGLGFGLGLGLLNRNGCDWLFVEPSPPSVFLV